MKTVITQKIESIPSSAIHGKTLETQSAITVRKVKEESIGQSARHSDKQQQSQKLRLVLALTLGSGSLMLSSFVNSAVVNQQETLPGMTRSESAAKSSPLSTLANSSKNLGQSVQADTGFIYPLVNPAPLTSPFGWRRHPVSGQWRLHGGVDLEAPYGAPIVAAIAGKVVVADWHGGHGKTVVIERQGNFQTLYAHMSKILVQKGKTVQPGEVIGYVGSTGRSTGAHLHFETLLPGKEKDSWVAVDPAPGVRYALNYRQQSVQLSSISSSSRVN